MASTKGLWVLLDAQLKLVDYREWEDSERGDLWKELENQLSSLLESNTQTLENIRTLFCVSGPGAYTGLRIASAYCKGLSLSLGIAMIGVPSIDLNNGEAFFIPVRQQLIRDLTQVEALSDSRNFEFLKITGKYSAELLRPTPKDLLWGSKDLNQTWPSAEQFAKAISTNINKTQPFEIFYGLGPKVFGEYLKEDR
ncbi:hypothetical protein GW915_02835 [bacterium]|nr:hypothetical protein [bacterium]